jgi:hypothetical protein
MRGSAGRWEKGLTVVTKEDMPSDAADGETAFRRKFG